jgi:hypothetical protein
MDIEAHARDKREIIRLIRDWLNTNRDSETPPLPGAAAINDDHNAYQRIAADIIATLRFDTHDTLPHGDYLYVVGKALPMIESARQGSAAEPWRRAGKRMASSPTPLTPP